MAPAGGYVVAWHFSLQHEAIHSFRSAPQWLRWAVVMPPIGLWLPFPLLCWLGARGAFVGALAANLDDKSPKPAPKPAAAPQPKPAAAGT